MSLGPEEWQKVWLLSDKELYPQAVVFVREFLEEQEERDNDEPSPLPATQANGLLNIIDGPDFTVKGNYGGIAGFISHQRGRDWGRSKEHIKDFYTKLEKTLERIQKTYVEQVTTSADKQDRQDVMLLLTREFIHHLVAENGLELAKRKR